MNTSPSVAGIVADADTHTEARIYFHTPEWESLLEWLEFHGIDPRQIPAGTRVSRDACGRCIRYVRVVVDEQGKRRQSGLDAGPGEPANEWITEAAIEQGEAPPLPFPGIITAILEEPPR